ncbi:MAG: hypothetical protein JRG86_21035 [Deltaproteobacteria bacterium]|jgi:hypothetical protein|nr:hypothetical protein [Deltaproteobacteria bacterium]
MLRSTRSVFVALIAISFLIVPSMVFAKSKEESKIQIRLTAPNGNGNGNGKGKSGPRGDIRTHLQGSKVEMQLRVKSLEPETEHVLFCREDEMASEGDELLRFETTAKGAANDKFDLRKQDENEAPVDPRGCYLVLAEASDLGTDVLTGWLYGAPEDDGPMTKVKEVTSLEPDETSDPEGSVEASYRMAPNGKGRLMIGLHRVAEGDYVVFVDGDEVATLTPNPGGNARVDFRTQPSKGKGSGKVKPHNKKKQLSFDPRRKLIEVELDNGDGTTTPMFAGPMLAQIEGLNSCSEEIVSETPLVDGATAASGTARLENESDCETAFDVEVFDVDAGIYEVDVDGAMVGDFEAADDGTGVIAGGIRFDPTPEAGEELLDFPVGSDSLVEIFEEGADRAVDAPVLSGTLP